MPRSFIESPFFPINLIDEQSAREKKGGGKPEIWEIVFWWTRKPLISARSFILGSILDENTSVSDFIRFTRLGSEKTPHRLNPIITDNLKKKLGEMSLLDPFAGFGSIPLEAIRLGIGRVVAVEFLPTSFVFLKAVLEIPKWVVDEKLDRLLIRDIEKWGKWIIEELRRDPDIRELYDEDTAVYIGTWEVKCPYCGKYTSLVGNWWLARVKKKSKYKRLAWMEPYIIDDRVEIKIRDLNKELALPEISARVTENTVSTNKGTYRVPEPNIRARTDYALCLHCSRVLPGKRNDWYIKKALRDWNNKIEEYLNGIITLKEFIEQTLVKPRLLAKVKVINKELIFEPATKQDNEKLWKALEKLKQIWGDLDIPTEQIPKYENRRITPILEAKLWYQFFNPRQLLTLVKLVKLIREAGKKIELEKLGENWDKQKANKYAEAVTTYLAMVLCKHADWNSVVSGWQLSYLIAAHTLAMRGVAMVWNWGEYNPLSTYRGTLSAMLSSMLEAIKYLIDAISGSPSRVSVVLDDATILSKLGDEKFDLIVTDPPYRDDVPYSELSDFYYVWLKRALSDVEHGVLKPRFYCDAFFECLDEECSSVLEIRTQWEKYSKYEISVNLGRSKFFNELEKVDAGSDEDFARKLGLAFKRMSELLKDHGVLVTYYAHTDPGAWSALLNACWRISGFVVTVAYAVATESEERVTARGKVALDSSVVIVWRKGSTGSGFIQDVELKAIEKASSTVSDLLKAGKELDINLFLGSLSSVLNVFTSYSKLLPDIPIDELVISRIFPLSLKAIVEGVYKATGIQKLPDPVSSAYIALKTTTRTGKELERTGRFVRGRVDRTFASLLSVFGGISIELLINNKLLVKKKEELEILEPEPDSLSDLSIRNALESLLVEKGIDLANPVLKTSVDVLHYLEYKALSMTSSDFKKLVENLEFREPRIQQAIELAKILERISPVNDPEKKACRRILNYLGLLKLEQRGGVL